MRFTLVLTALLLFQSVPARAADAAPAPQMPVSTRTKVSRILWTLTVAAMLGGAAGVLGGIAVGGGIPFLLNASSNDVELGDVSSVAGGVGLVLFGAGLLVGLAAWPLLAGAIVVGWKDDTGPPGYQQ